MAKLKDVKTLTDIKMGDTLIISGDTMKNEAVKVEVVKISDSDGTEIIFDRRQNRFFQLRDVPKRRKLGEGIEIGSLTYNTQQPMARFEIEIPEKYLQRLEIIAQADRRKRKPFCEMAIMDIIEQRTVKVKNKWVLRREEPLPPVKLYQNKDRNPNYPQ